MQRGQMSEREREREREEKECASGVPTNGLVLRRLLLLGLGEMVRDDPIHCALLNCSFAQISASAQCLSLHLHMLACFLLWILLQVRFNWVGGDWPAMMQ